MLTNAQFTCLAERYIDTVFRVALNYLKSPQDAEDVTQEVFLKLLQAREPFAGEDHVKHWLIRVTINQCKNLTRTKWWRMESLEDHAQALTFLQPEHSDLYDAVMALPRKYRLPIYLYHYEGYSTDEVSELLNIPKGTICTQLKRGRELLKRALTEVEDYV